jgi:prevent-host-death family protein
MRKTVNIHQAKTHLSSLLEEVRGGCEIIIAKAGKPYARLLPLEMPSRVPLGFLEGSVPDSIFDPLPEEELKAWEGDSVL